MALATECLTSGAVFHTEIGEQSVSIKVDLPRKLDVSEDEARILEALMHNQLELVLRYYCETR